MDAVNGKVSGSFAEYAKHRGVSKAAVSKTRKKPWFAPAVAVRDGKEYIADFAMADRLWEHHSDPTRASSEAKDRLSRIARSAPPSDDPRPSGQGPEGEAEDDAPTLSPAMSMADAARADKYWSAMRRKQEFEVAAGLLVNAAERDADEVTRVTFAKTKLLGIPSKAKSALPHLAHGDIAVIDGLIRDALIELADEGKRARGEAA